MARLIQKLTEGTYSMHKAALLIAALSLVSQLLAIVRDKILAHMFGAGEVLDIYYAAFRIPDLLYALVSSVLAAIIFLPLFRERADMSKEKSDYFTHSVFTIFIIAATTLSVVAFVCMPFLVHISAPGFTAEKMQELVLLSRILLLSPILLGVSNLIGSLLQSTKKMFLYALAPVAYNVGIIAGIIFLAPIFGIQGIVYGVLVGALLHILIQLPALRAENIQLKLTRTIDWFGVKELVFTALPRVATLGLIQLSQLYLVSVATTLAVGSVAVFTFAFNIQTVPLSLIGVSYSVAAFPVLVQLFQKSEIQALWGSVISAMRHIIFWSIPVICFAVVFRAHIVRLLYGSGEFTWTDTRLTAAVFAIMIISLAAQGLSLLFMRTLYAMRYSYVPLFGQITALAATFVVSGLGFFVWQKYPIFQYFLESLFRVEGIQGTSVMIIALAHALSSITLTAFLWISIHKAIPFARSSVCRRVFIHSLGASLVGASVCYGVLVLLTPYISLETFFGVLSSAVIAAFFGGVAWFVILYILGSIELHEFTQALKKRFWKTEVEQPELQEL